MKLSQAIREGAKLRRPVRSRYFGFIGHAAPNAPIGSCAFGAAVEAVTGKAPTVYVDWLGVPALKFPVPKMREFIERTFGIDEDVIRQVQLMHDKQGKSREQVADILEAQGL